MQPQNIITQFIELTCQMYDAQRAFYLAYPNSEARQNYLKLSKRLEKEFLAFREKYAVYLQPDYTENLVNKADQNPPIPPTQASLF